MVALYRSLCEHSKIAGALLLLAVCECMTAQVDFYCRCCALPLLAIDGQQQSSSNSERVRVPCSQQRRAQQSASMHLRVPVARRCCHVGRLHTRHTATCLACCSLEAFSAYFFLRTQVEPIPSPSVRVYMTCTSLAQSSDEALIVVCPSAAAVHYRDSPTESSSSVIITVYRKGSSARPCCCVHSYLAV